jgi:hypothetical protein
MSVAPEICIFSPFSAERGGCKDASVCLGRRDVFLSAGRWKRRCVYGEEVYFSCRYGVCCQCGRTINVADGVCGSSL